MVYVRQSAETGSLLVIRIIYACLIVVTITPLRFGGILFRRLARRVLSNALTATMLMMLLICASFLLTVQW